MEQAVVSVPICPLMSAPSLQSERADEALMGWPLELLERPCAGWLLVRTHYRYTGYAPERCLHLGAESDGQNKLLVWRGLCDVLSAPSIKAPRLETLTRGALIAPLGEPDAQGWQRVILPGGREGYTKRSFLSFYSKTPRFSHSSALRAAVIAAAKCYLGVSYRWGGKTPVGIDCSGLAFMSYFLNGILIYRDARMEEGFPIHPIPLSQVAPADLLYFPGHVALYLGEGCFLHATAKDGSDGVVISSLSPGGPDYRPDLRESLLAAGSFFPPGGFPR